MRRIDADEFKRQIAGMAIANNYSPQKANSLETDGRNYALEDCAYYRIFEV